MSEAITLVACRPYITEGVTSAMPSHRTCSIPGCERHAVARGWCKGHYSHWNRYGTEPTLSKRGLKPWTSFRHDKAMAEPLARFVNSFTVNPETLCWEWDRDTNYGYARMAVARRGVRAHRFSYEWFVGPIPSGLVLDHLCRVKRCVNPDHLEAVTDYENLLRGNTVVAFWANKTECSKGHSYTPENTYLYPDGERGCRTCKNGYQRAKRAAAVDAACLKALGIGAGV